MKFTVSDLGSFTCRRQWWLGRSWKSPHLPQALWFGQLVHAGLEAYYRGEDPLNAAQDFVEAQFDEFDRELPYWRDRYNEFVTTAELSLSVLHNYTIFDENKPVVPGGDVVGVERSIRLPIPGTDHVLSGRLDLIVTRGDRLWIVDHKTMGSISSPAGLDVDEQMTAYAYMAWKTFDVIPSGIIYNMVARAVPAEPRVLKDGDLSRDITQSTVYDLYLAALQEKGRDPNDYAKVLNHLHRQGWDRFFLRAESTRNLKELLAFEKRVRRKALDLQHIVEVPDEWAYPSPSSWTCSYCPFLAVCKSMDDGGDWEYQLTAQFVKAR